MIYKLSVEEAVELLPSIDIFTEDFLYELRDNVFKDSSLQDSYFNSLLYESFSKSFWWCGSLGIYPNNNMYVKWKCVDKTFTSLTLGTYKDINNEQSFNKILEIK